MIHFGVGCLATLVGTTHGTLIAVVAEPAQMLHESDIVHMAHLLVVKHLVARGLGLRVSRWAWRLTTILLVSSNEARSSGTLLLIKFVLALDYLVHSLYWLNLLRVLLLHECLTLLTLLVLLTIVIRDVEDLFECLWVRAHTACVGTG